MGSMLMRKTFEFVGKKHAQTKRAVKGYTLHLSEITFAQARSNERGSCHIARLFWAQFFFSIKIRAQAQFCDLGWSNWAR